jgi:glycosyltransferase involved in cell wall biosynthesis
MGYGNCLAVNDTPENREVAGEAALYFRARAPETLTALLERLLAEPETGARLRAAAVRRARERYSWEPIADRYAELLRALARGGGAERPG